MEEQFITVFGDILSGKESPRRIRFAESPTNDESGFIVDCGRPLLSISSRIGMARFLESHPELIAVLSQMEVGDVAERDDRTDGCWWTIQDPKGMTRQSIHLPET